MSWECLSAEVACMFAEHTWRTDDYEMALEIRVASVRKSNAERKAQYRRNNPEQRRKDAEHARRWAAKNREYRRQIERASYRRRIDRMSPMELAAYRSRRQEQERARQRAKNKARFPWLRESEKAPHCCSQCGQAGHNRRRCPKTA